MRSQIGYPSRLFRDFRSIESTDFRNCVRFFERNEKMILQLEFDEYFEMLHAYAQALFEVGEYEKCVLMSEVVVQVSVEQNFTHFKGVEIFENMLYQKAAAHFNSNDYAKSQYVLTELLRINPTEPDYRNALEGCLRQRYAPRLKASRAVGIFLLSIVLVIFGFNVLVLRFFYEVQSQVVQQICILLCGVALLIPVIYYLVHRWKIMREVRQIIQKK
ncbi:MAG: hypothetical protein RL757_117 [Bacteroidota bacterium]|jgi:hypothetical protein